MTNMKDGGFHTAAAMVEAPTKVGINDDLNVSDI
jgi:hypothetical protein